MDKKNENKLGFLKTGLVYLGLLLSLLATFLGAIHFFEGQLVTSLIFTLVLLLGIYFLINQLIKKKEKLKKNSSLNRKISLFLYSLYFLLALPLSFFSIHGLNVELNAKPQVKNEYANVQVEFKGIEANFDEKLVELIKNSNINLSNYIARNDTAKLRKIYNINADLLKGDKDTLRKRKTEDIKSDLKEDYRKLMSEFKPVIIKSLGNIERWNLFELNTSMKLVDSKVPVLKKKIEDLFNDVGNKYEYSEKLTFKSTQRVFDLTKPIELLSKNSSYGLLLIVLLQHFLLLSPVILSSSDRKYNKTRNVGGGIEL